MSYFPDTSYSISDAATPQTLGAFNATDAFAGGSYGTQAPSYQYQQAVQQSPALPGNDGGMSQMQKYSMYGSMLGEAAHGVGNLVRAFKGMDPVKYPGTTLAQQAANRRKMDMQMKILGDLFGPPKTDMDKGIEKAEEAGAPSVTAQDPGQTTEGVQEESVPSFVEVPGVEADPEKDRLILESMRKRGDTSTYGLGTGVSFKPIPVEPFVGN